MTSTNGKYPPNWIDSYIELADLQSPMTPRAFHEAIGLWLTSTAISRRLVVKMAHDDIYPSLWVMILAPSTLYAKTTAMNLARRVMRGVAPDLPLPDTATPEALIESLSKSAQRGMALDEASGLMATSEREYMAGTLELLMRMYDCPPEYSRHTKGGGVTKIEAAYLTMLAASTPALMKRHLKSDRLWASGWWPRFGILMPPAERPEYRQAQYAEPGAQTNLVSALIRLRARLDCIPPAALDMIVDRDAMDAWQAFDKEARYDEQFDLTDNLKAAYGRAPTHAMKIATCLAAMDWPGTERTPRIEARQMQRAIAIARTWLADAEKALALSDEPDTNKNLERVRRTLIEAGGELVPLRELARRTHLTAGEIEACLTELEAVEEIESRVVRAGNRERLESRWKGADEVSQLSQPM